jgi:hypothetical protein
MSPETILFIICLIMCGVNIWQTVYFYKERAKLIDRIIAKSSTEYFNYALTATEPTKEREKKPASNKVVF